MFKGAQPIFDDFCDKVKVQIALWVKWSLEVDYSVDDIVFNFNQIRLSIQALYNSASGPLLQGV
mgnify:CR=1 FL=1